MRTKETYLVWINIIPHMAKSSRHTIGTRIENKFLNLLELTYIAYFSSKDDKIKNIDRCIFALDILKFLVTVTWEGKLIAVSQCQTIAERLEGLGRMFGGWKKSLENPEKKNRDLDDRGKK